MSTSWKIHNDFFSQGGEKVEVLGNYVCSTALFHHHFLKVQQAAYLKEAKAILDNKLASFWWIFWKIIVFLSKMQYKASFGRINKLHFIPSAVCHNDDNSKLKCDCYCVILDHLLHDQTADHCFISLVIPTICTRNPRINRIKFFSDDAASQYKNFKSLINLMYHEHDLKVT